MKHLKRYNESTDEEFFSKLKKSYKRIDNYNEVYREMQDILLEITDEGFTADIKKEGCIIKILIYKGNTFGTPEIDDEDPFHMEYKDPIEFKYSTISDCVERLIEYGKSSDFKVSSIRSFQLDPFGVCNDVKPNKDDNIYSLEISFMQN